MTREGCRGRDARPGSELSDEAHPPARRASLCGPRCRPFAPARNGATESASRCDSDTI